jgi:beta-glucanase (GH16 family)
MLADRAFSGRREPARRAAGSRTIGPVGVSRRFLVTLACATITLGALPVGVIPETAGAGEPGHAKAKKKKCKRKGRAAAAKRCRRKRGRPQAPSAPPAPTPPAPPGSEPPGDPGSDACGPRTARSEGGYWECSFSDDFDGAALDRRKWLPQRTAETGYVNGPSACFVDSPNNISVSDGTLRLTAREEAAPFNCAGLTMQYTSGMVTTAQGRFSQAYGRFEVRAKVSPAQVKGLQTSLWLWPDDSARYGPYPASGEIDIAELFSQYANRAIPYVHYSPLLLVDPLATNPLCVISDPSTFHAYAVVWTESSIAFSYDGRTCLVDHWTPARPLVKPQPFDQPFFIALTQALGVGTNEFDPETTPLPATTAVDYVRVWK